MANKFDMCIGLMLLIIVPSIVLSDYCKIKSCEERPHVACVYKPTEVAKRCSKNHVAGLTKTELKIIVDYHNDLRMKLLMGKEKRGRYGPLPKAKHMEELVWDKELASLAQRWANQCPEKGHDKCRNVEQFTVGQNIATQFTPENFSTMNVSKLLDSWSNEAENFDYREVYKLRLGNLDSLHYTAMIWAKTRRIGCGAMRYQDPKSPDRNIFYLVCNYGPAGNIIEEPVYETL